MIWNSNGDGSDRSLIHEWDFHLQLIRGEKGYPLGLKLKICGHSYRPMVSAVVLNSGGVFGLQLIS